MKTNNRCQECPNTLVKCVVKYGLTWDEVQALVNFFYIDGGYISHDRHELVHVAIRKMEAFIRHVDKNKLQNNQTSQISDQQS